MLTDRRPILLANARLIDPSRDFDGVGQRLAGLGRQFSGQTVRFITLDT